MTDLVNIDNMCIVDKKTIIMIYICKEKKDDYHLNVVTTDEIYSLQYNHFLQTLSSEDLILQLKQKEYIDNQILLLNRMLIDYTRIKSIYIDTTDMTYDIVVKIDDENNGNYNYILRRFSKTNTNNYLYVKECMQQIMEVIKQYNTEHMSHNNIAVETYIE